MIGRWWVSAGVCLLFVSVSQLLAAEYDLGGRSSIQYTGQSYPSNSLFSDFVGSTSNDLNADLRVVGSVREGAWDAKADYQLLVLHGDRVEYTRQLPGLSALFGRLPDDSSRLFDMTHVMRDQDKTAVLHRLDRLSVGYTGDKAVIRAGRQAISWGNGLVFAPMDIVNPFDPTAVDKEYKTGDDMLYGQYLRDSGDDVQAAVVARRNSLTGEVDSDEFTYAVKYHGMLDAAEFDVLLSRNYGENLLAVGGNRELGGAVWRADAVISDTQDDGAVWQFVSNLSYSWTWMGKNVSGLAEYFYNGFGRSDGCYSPDCLLQSPELLSRVARRELFTLGRHYVAASASIELTPLFMLTPNLFWNVEDGSALLQVNTRNDLAENLVLLGSVALPVGASGTEYGGIESGVPGRYLSQDFTVFLQLNWYY